MAIHVAAKRKNTLRIRILILSFWWWWLSNKTDVGLVGTYEVVLLEQEFAVVVQVVVNPSQRCFSTIMLKIIGPFCSISAFWRIIVISHWHGSRKRLRDNFVVLRAHDVATARRWPPRPDFVVLWIRRTGNRGSSIMVKKQWPFSPRNVYILTAKLRWSISATLSPSVPGQHYLTTNQTFAVPQ